MRKDRVQIERAKEMRGLGKEGDKEWRGGGGGGVEREGQ